MPRANRKTILTVTLNPAFDLHLSLKSFSPAKENYAQSARSDAGGKGINISRALKSCGVMSHAYVALGEENGKAFEEALSKDGIDYKAFYTPGRIRENITLHPQNTKETRVSLDTFSLAPDCFEEISRALLARASEDTLIAFAGRIPRGVKKEEVIRLLCALKRAGGALYIDSNSFTLADLARICPAFIKPNEEEVVSLCGHTPADEKEAANAALKMVEDGIAERVMISLGGRGAAFANRELVATVSVPAITPISTIGAGDSTIAGILAASVGYRQTLPNTLRLGCAFGTAACLTEGTCPPRLADVDRIYKETKCYIRPTLS